MLMLTSWSVTCCHRTRILDLTLALALPQDGNSLVTFPEGTRSKDGRVADFKKGPFTMAARSGVKIVPISIIGAGTLSFVLNLVLALIFTLVVAVTLTHPYSTPRSGTHLFQPPGAFVPFAIPRGIRIVIHAPLDPPAEKQVTCTLPQA